MSYDPYFDYQLLYGKPKKYAGPKRIGVTSGMRGFYAVLYDNDGPIQSGCGSFETRDEALEEARDWAMAEGLRCDE